MGFQRDYASALGSTFDLFFELLPANIPDLPINLQMCFVCDVKTHIGDTCVPFVMSKLTSGTHLKCSYDRAHEREAAYGRKI